LSAVRQRPPGWALLYAGVVLVAPALAYLALIAVLGEKAAALPGPFLTILMPFVIGSPVLAFLSLAVAGFAFVGFRRSRARRMAGASLVWLLGAAAYAFTAQDFASRLTALESLLRW